MDQMITFESPVRKLDHGRKPFDISIDEQSPTDFIQDEHRDLNEVEIELEEEDEGPQKQIYLRRTIKQLIMLLVLWMIVMLLYN